MITPTKIFLSLVVALLLFFVGVYINVSYEFDVLLLLLILIPFVATSGAVMFMLAKKRIRLFEVATSLLIGWLVFDILARLAVLAGNDLYVYGVYYFGVLALSVDIFLILWLKNTENNIPNELANTDFKNIYLGNFLVFLGYICLSILLVIGYMNENESWLALPLILISLIGLVAVIMGIKLRNKKIYNTLENGSTIFKSIKERYQGRLSLIIGLGCVVFGLVVSSQDAVFLIVSILSSIGLVAGISEARVAKNVITILGAILNFGLILCIVLYMLAAMSYRGP